MANKLPTYKLKSGYEMPLFGLGTWKSNPGEVRAAVAKAIELGYRHIDCAHVYQNEQEVGQALTDKMADGTVKRQDLFITSKLWNTRHSPELVEPSLRTSIKELGLEYLDLYLIHYPIGFKEGDEFFPKDENGVALMTDVDYVDTWRAMEKCVELGLVRSIGVSNFNHKQIERIQSVAKLPICNNQVECHPYLPQKKLMKFCQDNDILLTAYSPLGTPDRPWAKPGDVELMKDPKIVAIAERVGKSVAQVLIRFQLQQGNAVIPKSVNAQRIEQNMNVYDFELSADDMTFLESQEKTERYCSFTTTESHQYYPFTLEY